LVYIWYIFRQDLVYSLKEELATLAAATSRRHKELQNHWCQTATTAELVLLRNSIVFATFVQ